MEKNVFISYKSEEFEAADNIRKYLEANGVTCWMAPSCIRGGSSYAAEIPNAIRSSELFLLVLSEKAQESRWVPRELDQAINLGKTILPFMIEYCALNDDFSFYLTNVQRYEAYKDSNGEAARLLKDIKSMLAENKGSCITGQENTEAKVDINDIIIKDEQVFTPPKKEKKKKNFLTKITPYGYRGAKDPKMNVPRIMANIYAGFCAFLYMIVYLAGYADGSVPGFMAICVIILSSLALWHTAYASGLLWKKIPKILAFVLQLMFTFVAFFVYMILGVIPFAV